MKQLGMMFAILLIAILLLPVIPVMPVDSANITIGTKVIRDNGAEAIYLGRTPGGNHIWQTTIGSPQYLDDLVTPIDASWDYDVGKDEWNACDNLFTALVKGTKVTVWYEGLKLSWQPDVFIGTKKQAVGYPQLIINDPINDNYIGNTLRWYYGDITRSVRIIEGMLREYYTITESPGEDILIISHSEKDAGFVWTRPVVAWDSEGKPVNLIVDGDDLTLTVAAMEGAAFPITIDPDATFTSSTSDGYTTYYGGNYTTVHDNSNGSIQVAATSFPCGQAWLGYYIIYRAFPYFDTSSIPDGANITDATLKLYGTADSSAIDFNITVQDGQPTYPHDPLEADDYNHSYYSGDGGNFNTSNFSTTSYNNITLNTSWVQKGSGAATKLALVSSRDINSTVPTGNEYVAFWSAEKGVGYYPLLVITYVASAVPTITTNAATYITRTTAKLNAYLSDDGGEACDVRFQYGNSTGNYTTNTSWINDTYTTGDSPYANIGSLTNSTEYFFRVQAVNSEGTTNGSELSFTTIAGIYPPTNFRAYPNSTSISLSWIKGIGATYTMIRGQVGGYPANPVDGTQIYNGTMSTASHEGLTKGTVYYYRAWSYDSISYSDNYTDILMTTSAFTEVGVGTPASPTTPSNWWGVPDYTGLSNIAGYEFVNEIADQYEIPRNTFWMSLIIIGIMCIGLFIYSVQHNATVAILLTSVMIVVASIAGLLPLLFIAIIGIPAASIFLIKRRV